MWRKFGPPSCFLTVAPDDVHQYKSIQLSYRVNRTRGFPVDPSLLTNVFAKDEASLVELQSQLLPDEYDDIDESFRFELNERFLQRLASANPVATTLVYEELVSAVFSEESAVQG